MLGLHGHSPIQSSRLGCEHWCHLGSAAVVQVYVAASGVHLPDCESSCARPLGGRHGADKAKRTTYATHHVEPRQLAKPKDHMTPLTSHVRKPTCIRVCLSFNTPNNQLQVFEVPAPFPKYNVGIGCRGTKVVLQYPGGCDQHCSQGEMESVVKYFGVLRNS